MKALYQKFMVLVDWITGAMAISLVILFIAYALFHFMEFFLDLVTRY